VKAINLNSVIALFGTMAILLFPSAAVKFDYQTELGIARPSLTKELTGGDRGRLLTSSRILTGGGTVAT